MSFASQVSFDLTMGRKHSAASSRGWGPLAHVRRAVTDRRRAPASSAHIATGSPNLSIVSPSLGFWRDGAPGCRWQVLLRRHIIYCTDTQGAFEGLSSRLILDPLMNR